jgi:thiol-disulfide isomerase/thioredoxin
MSHSSRRQASHISRTLRPPSKAQIVTILATLIGFASIVAIAIVNNKSVSASASIAPPISTLLVGQNAPPFSVSTIDGKRIDSSRIAGPTMLEVFATWCPHCQHETAQINTMQRRFGKRLAIVAVSGSDTGSDRQSPETLSDVEGFAKYFSVVYPIAFDPQLAVAKSYLQGGFPTIVFINARKRITAIESGEVALKTLASDAKGAGVRETQ